MLQRNLNLGRQEKVAEPSSCASRKVGHVPQQQYTDDDAQLLGFTMVRNHVASHSDSDECLKQLQFWLDKCTNQHTTYCIPPSIPGERATAARFLHIREGLGQPFDVRVVAATEHNYRYIALSYCWGRSKSLTTTSQNLAAHCRTISFKALPGTFQDAIIITQRLGIQYIWIDALCIVQDDKEDWDRESAKMASIYQHSYLTISATAGASSDSGCFSRRPRQGQSFRLGALESTSGEKTVVYLREKLEHTAFHGFTTSTGIKDHGEYPMFSRGWCLQERILSPRIIHYSATELIWECRTSVECECGTLQGGNVSWGKPGLERKLRRVDHNAAVKDIATDSTRHFAKSWEEIITDYTTMSLTKESDIFPAIAGVANMMQTKGLDGYLAGLWDNDIARGLLWYTSHERYNINGSYMADEFLWNLYKDSYPAKISRRASSWSWASILGPVHWHTDTEDAVSAVKLIRAEPALSTTNHFFAMSHNLLILRGVVVKGKLSWFDDEECRMNFVELQLDSGKTLYGAQLDTAPKQEELRMMSDCVFYSMRVLMLDENREKWTWGLILREDQAQPGCFKRIGWHNAQLNHVYEDVEESEVV
ncbi:hypothetical protein MMC17_008620 [Xylographa soralifera]|nr:hypothetical protein [Xylographa soralifera]